MYGAAGGHSEGISESGPIQTSSGSLGQFPAAVSLGSGTHTPSQWGQLPGKNPGISWAALLPPIVASVSASVPASVSGGASVFASRHCGAAQASDLGSHTISSNVGDTVQALNDAKMKIHTTNNSRLLRFIARTPILRSPVRPKEEAVDRRSVGSRVPPACRDRGVQNPHFRGA